MKSVNTDCVWAGRVWDGKKKQKKKHLTRKFDDCGICEGEKKEILAENINKTYKHTQI